MGLQTATILSSFYIGSTGSGVSEFWSSWLHGKHFIYWAISPDHKWFQYITLLLYLFRRLKQLLPMKKLLFNLWLQLQSSSRVFLARGAGSISVFYTTAICSCHQAPALRCLLLELLFYYQRQRYSTWASNRAMCTEITVWLCLQNASYLVTI